MPLFPAWGFLGLFAGPWKLAIVGVAIWLALGGSSRRFRRVGILRPTRTEEKRIPFWEDRVFLFLLVLAATALASWIVTRMTVTSSPIAH